MNSDHRRYFREIYPSIWRNKIHQYGMTPYLRSVIAFLRGRIASGSRILEVAVGTGEPIAKALSDIGKFCGVDLARASLEEARRTLPEAFLCEASAEQLPFADGVFDAAYCLQSSWNMESAELPLREMLRVTAAGGLCVMDLMNRYSPRIALTHTAMRARSWVVPGLAGFCRERGSDPWRLLKTLPPDAEGILLCADDLGRPAGRWADRFAPRLVLVVEKREVRLAPG